MFSIAVLREQSFHFGTATSNRFVVLFFELPVYLTEKSSLILLHKLEPLPYPKIISAHYWGWHSYPIVRGRLVKITPSRKPNYHYFAILQQHLSAVNIKKMLIKNVDRDSNETKNTLIFIGKMQF